MLKKMLTGVALSLLIAAPAFAHEPADGKGGTAITPELRSEDPPGPTSVPGPPGTETPEAKVELEYKLGVNGFLRGEATGSFRLSDFSYQPGHSEGRFLYRVKPYGYWHPTDYLDFHLEGQGYGFSGGGADDGQLSLYQGYVEAKLPGSDAVALKAGRQEFSYGSNFMLGPDAFYNGLSFDSGRLRLQPAKDFSVDILGGTYAGPQADGVKGTIAAAYASYTISDGNGIEGYFLRDNGSLQHHKGEAVNSFGVRGTAKAGPVSFELEPVYQTGEVLDPVREANDDISAFGGHLDVTADLEAAGMHHKLWGGFAAGSGSRAAANGGSPRHEFHNPNNDTAIVGDMNVFGDLSGGTVSGHHASGLQVYTLGWGVDITKQVSLSATGHYFRAAAVQSGLSRELGLETDFCLTYTVSDNFSLLLAYDRLFTGSFFKGASGSGDDIQYGYAMLQFNLEKAKQKAPKKGA